MIDTQGSRTHVFIPLEYVQKQFASDDLHVFNTQRQNVTHSQSADSITDATQNLTCQNFLLPVEFRFCCHDRKARRNNVEHCASFTFCHHRFISVLQSRANKLTMSTMVRVKCRTIDSWRLCKDFGKSCSHPNTLICLFVDVLFFVFFFSHQPVNRCSRQFFF